MFILRPQETDSCQQGQNEALSRFLNLGTNFQSFLFVTLMSAVNNLERPFATHMAVVTLLQQIYLSVSLLLVTLARKRHVRICRFKKQPSETQN